MVKTCVNRRQAKRRSANSGVGKVERWAPQEPDDAANPRMRSGSRNFTPEVVLPGDLEFAVGSSDPGSGVWDGRRGRGHWGFERGEASTVRVLDQLEGSREVVDASSVGRHQWRPWRAMTTRGRRRPRRGFGTGFSGRGARRHSARGVHASKGCGGVLARGLERDHGVAKPVGAAQAACAARGAVRPPQRLCGWLASPGSNRPCARACRVAVNEMGRQGKGAWLPGQ